MTNQPLHDSEAEQQYCRQEESSSPTSCCFYAGLCALKDLQQAYAHVKENSRELGIDPLAIETIEAKGVEVFLQHLSDDLQVRTYHPSQVAEREGRIVLRDRLIGLYLGYGAADL